MIKIKVSLLNLTVYLINSQILKVFVVLCRYVWSGLIVVLGIYLNIYNKNKAKWNASILYYINQFSFNSLKLFAARHGRMSVNREHIV